MDFRKHGKKEEILPYKVIEEKIKLILGRLSEEV